MIRVLLSAVLLLYVAAPAFAQTYFAAYPNAVVQFFDDSGLPLAGGLLYTYAAGTTNAQTTYTDSTGGTPNANPVVLDASGRASVWLSSTNPYKLVLQTSTGASVWTKDNVSDFGATLKRDLAASFATKSLDGTKFASQYTGANGGAQIANAITDVASTGGLVMAPQGTEAWTSDPFSGVSKPVLIDLGAGTTTISADVTVPANVTLRFNEGAILSVNSGKTLTINGSILAPRTQLFAGAGAVKIGGRVSGIFPEWFAGSDAGAKIAAAMAAVPSAGGIVDGTGFSGAQSISQNMWSGITAPVNLITAARAVFTSTKTQQIQCTGCSWDAQGGHYVFAPIAPFTLNTNDRAIVAGSTPSSSITPASASGYPITGSISAGARSFVATNNADCAVMTPGDYLMVIEADSGLGDLVNFEWAEVSSLACPTVNVYAPFRTTYTGTHGVGIQWYRIPAASLVHDVTLRNLSCQVTTDDGSQLMPCISAANARGIVWDNLDAQPIRGQAFYTYRVGDFKLTNSRQLYSAHTVDSEFAESQDVALIGNTFGTHGAAPDYTSLTLDFGINGCTVMGNHFNQSADTALRMFHGVRNCVITGNTFAWIHNLSGGTTTAITALGSTGNYIAGNRMDGATAGSSSQAIAMLNDSGATVNITSTANLIGPNVVENFVNPFGAAQSGDSYFDVNGPLADGFGAAVGSRPSSFSGALTCCNTNSDGLTLGWDSATPKGYLAWNYTNTDGTESVKAAGRGSWRMVLDNSLGTESYGIDFRAGSAAAGTFTHFLTLDKDAGLKINNADGSALGGLTVGSGGNRIMGIYIGSSGGVDHTGYDQDPIPANTTARLNTAITVTGASANDIVSCSPTAYLGSGLVYSAYVSAADTVQIVVGNTKTSTVTPSTVSWNCIDFRKQ